MGHFKININLSKLNGAFIRTIQGQHTSKRCVCIPIDENNVFEGQKGNYLSLVAIKQENPCYGKSHLLKISYPKEQYEAMSWVEKSALAVVGSMKEIV